MDKNSFNEKFPTFTQYYETLDKLAHLVAKKSLELNITAIRNYDDIWKKHIIDSLMISKLRIWKEDQADFLEKHILDLGTGAGFPGLVLAIVNVSSEFTLIDGTRKKVKAVQEFINELCLVNVKALWTRSESIENNPLHREKYDLVVSRSVAYLPNLIRLARPFVCTNGKIAAYKSYDRGEISEGDKLAERLNLKRHAEYYYKIDGSPRRVIIVYKTLS